MGDPLPCAKRLAVAMVEEKLGKFWKDRKKNYTVTRRPRGCPQHFKLSALCYCLVEERKVFSSRRLLMWFPSHSILHVSLLTVSLLKSNES